MKTTQAVLYALATACFLSGMWIGGWRGGMTLGFALFPATFGIMLPLFTDVATEAYLRHKIKLTVGPLLALGCLTVVAILVIVVRGGLA